jgi:hypothetical protein
MLPNPDRNGHWADWAVALVRQLRPSLPNISKGQATLGTGTSTVVSAQVTKFQKVFPSPASDAAFQARPFVSSVADGSFTLTHASGVSGRLVDWLAY